MASPPPSKSQTHTTEDERIPSSPSKDSEVVMGGTSPSPNQDEQRGEEEEDSTTPTGPENSSKGKGKQTDEEADEEEEKESELRKERAAAAKGGNNDDDEEEEDEDEDEDSDDDEEDEDDSPPPPNPLDEKARERAERFRALRARAKTSATANLQAVHAERRRQQQDPRTLLKLQRLRSTAEFNLAKHDALASGEDFDRKRAWDWTIDESQSWDKKLQKKQKHVADVAFQDYTQTARKIYKKQIREMGKANLEKYEKEKLERVVREGQVFEEVVDEESGETRLVAVDTRGSFYADKDSLAFVENRPRKEGVDKLVGDLKRQEERRAKNKKGKGDEEDVTYINDKNKQFNMKLARYYNKYTGEIRDSFERGTMI